MTQWKILPYDPVPRHIKPKHYPAFGRFGLLYGLIEWGITMILETFSRQSVNGMPVVWKHNLVELNNARYEAEKIRKRHKEAQDTVDKTL